MNCFHGRSVSEETLMQSMVLWHLHTLKTILSQVEAERRAHEQEENKASEEYIQKLLAEEEEEHRLAEERRKEMEEQQLKQDEELAWQLSNSLVSEHNRGCFAMFI